MPAWRYLDAGIWGTQEKSHDPEKEKDVKRLSSYLAKSLHIPAGLAVILAAVLFPKVLALVMVGWYVIGMWLARKWKPKI